MYSYLSRIVNTFDTQFKFFTGVIINLLTVFCNINKMIVQRLALKRTLLPFDLKAPSSIDTHVLISILRQKT